MHHLMYFNWWAILVATLIQFLLGALWYSFLFAKPWMALKRCCMDRAKVELSLFPVALRSDV